MPPGASRDERKGRLRGSDTPPSGATAPPGDAAAWCQALELWLAWNEAYERTTAELYQAGGDPQALEAVMDRLDALRQQAIGLSRRLLSDAKR